MMIDCKNAEYELIDFDKGINLMGKKFGHLSVIARVRTLKDKKAKWLCMCDICGSEICVTSNHLLSGHTTSCGCARHKDNKEVEDILDGLSSDN